MAKRRNRKPLLVKMNTPEAAEHAVDVWNVQNFSADDLRALARKIWEDAYELGKSEAKAEAAVEAAEAEWFGG